MLSRPIRHGHNGGGRTLDTDPLKTLLTVIGAVVVPVVATNTVAFAATGHALILGKVNKANKVTTLKRTTDGPALSLIARPLSSAPFTVNTTGKVTNLNADSVDGRDASAFQPAIGALGWQNLPLGAGWSTCYTGTPQYAVRLGVVYFRGSLCGGANHSTVFTVPAQARPIRTGDVDIPVAQCNGATGRIDISTITGSTAVESDPLDLAAATCFVSLEGISYPVS